MTTTQMAALTASYWNYTTKGYIRRHVIH